MKRNFSYSLVVLLLVVLFVTFMSISCADGGEEPGLEVTFNANGGPAISPTSKTVTNGSTYGKLATAIRDDYTLSWNTQANGNGTEVKSTTVVTIMTDHTLYAK